MHNQEIKNILRNTDLFSEANDEFLTKISNCAHYKKLAKNEILINENSISKEIYIIVSGRFVVTRLVESGHPEAEFNLLQKGTVVGELSFIDEQPRSATVKALDDDCAVIEIQKQDLIDIAPTSFYQKLTKKLSTHLRNTNEIIIANLKKEIILTRQMMNMGRFITYILLLISFYNLALFGFSDLASNPYASMFASTIIIGIFTVAMFILVLHMHYPLSRCGLNLNNWQTAVFESVLFSAIFIVILTFVYWFYISYLAHGITFKLVNFERVVKVFAGNTFYFYAWLFAGMFVYAVFANFQEFIARGVLQSALQDFLLQKHKYLIANIVTSGVFASMHIHLSTLLPYLVFIPSLFWGWLFIRHKTLLSPIISHIMIGWWAIFVLGLQDFHP